jgi:hypothetical protein
VGRPRSQSHHLRAAGPVGHARSYFGGPGVRAPSLVASPLLLAELERALAYTKLRTRIHEDEATAVVGWIRRSATIAQDRAEPVPRASEDPGDDYRSRSTRTSGPLSCPRIATFSSELPSSRSTLPPTFSPSSIGRCSSASSLTLLGRRPRFLCVVPPAALSSPPKPQLASSASRHNGRGAATLAARW